MIYKVTTALLAITVTILFYVTMYENHNRYVEVEKQYKIIVESELDYLLNNSSFTGREYILGQLTAYHNILCNDNYNYGSCLSQETMDALHND